VARVIVSRFPELKVYLSQDRAWKEDHHKNIFDAVELGITPLKRKLDDFIGSYKMI
jgi:expansin (peptidoglycan-binding protein)